MIDYKDLSYELKEIDFVKSELTTRKSSNCHRKSVFPKCK